MKKEKNETLYMPINRYFLSDFVSVQRESFFQLLEKGLIEEFSKRNPIIHRKKDCSYFFYPEYYILTRPEYRPSEAIVKNKSYTSKLYVPVQITNKKEKKITLKWVYIGNIPLMTKRGHFILNGATRVIVNQILRSPGAYYQQKIYENYERDNNSKNKDDGAENSENQNDSNVFLQTENTYKRFYCDLICMRGSWLRIEMDKEKSIWVQMKRGPKIPVFWFLLAMGLSEKFILKSITDSEKLLGNLERNNLRTTRLSSNKDKSRILEKKGSAISDRARPPRGPRSAHPWGSFADSALAGTTREGGGGAAPPYGAREGGYAQKSSKKKGIGDVFNIADNVREDREPSANYDRRKTGNTDKEILSEIELGNNNTIEDNETEQTSKKINYPYLKNPPEAWESIYTLLHSKSAKSLRLENEKHRAPQRGAEGTEKVGKQRREADFQIKNEFSENGVLRDSQTSRPSRVGATRENIMSRVLPRTTTKSLTELGRQWLYNRFMNPRSYDLGKQGRIALNQKLGLNISPQQLTLTGLDLLYATDYLIKLDKGLYKVDDIDHLKNRRVRTSGELIQIQIGVGLVRLEKFLRYSDMNVEPTAETAIFDSRSARETLTRPDALPLTPHFEKTRETRGRAAISDQESRGGLMPARGEISRRLRGQFKSTLTSSRINSKAFNSAIREFFGTSPLSQFMDQINPLAELTHKRRLSSMGPGGVTRDTATLAIRGIHPTHYGRICPIETPEGKNTGLVNSMTTYARVNYAGLLESPFYKVYKGQVQKNTGMYFLTAEQEEKIKLAAADLFVSRIGFLPKSMIPVRIAETFTKIDRKSVQFIGVSPLQMISIAASLIPFLEHDDANRALMGSNMQRQAVPLIRPQRPIVGTGLEGKAVSDSGHVVQAKNSGLITYVSSKKIIVSEPCARS
jgi:DNA-directed RNA polymerase beta subunit